MGSNCCVDTGQLELRVSVHPGLLHEAQQMGESGARRPSNASSVTWGSLPWGPPSVPRETFSLWT